MAYVQSLRVCLINEELTVVNFPFVFVFGFSPITRQKEKVKFQVNNAPLDYCLRILFLQIVLVCSVK